MTFEIYHQAKGQHARTVFVRRRIGTVDATNVANAVLEAMRQFKLEANEVALLDPYGVRHFPRDVRDRFFPKQRR